MHSEQQEPVLLTQQNLPKYQLQLTKIGVSKTQFDLSPYIGKPTNQVQEIINHLKLAHTTHRKF